MESETEKKKEIRWEIDKSLSLAIPKKLYPSDDSSPLSLHFQFMCISLVYSGRLIRHTLTPTPVNAINAAGAGVKQSSYGLSSTAKLPSLLT